MRYFTILCRALDKKIKLVNFVRKPEKCYHGDERRLFNLAGFGFHLFAYSVKRYVYGKFFCNILNEL